MRLCPSGSHQGFGTGLYSFVAVSRLNQRRWAASGLFTAVGGVRPFAAVGGVRLCMTCVAAPVLGTPVTMNK